MRYKRYKKTGIKVSQLKNKKEYDRQYWLKVTKPIRAKQVKKKREKKTGIKVSPAKNYNEYMRQYYHKFIKPKLRKKEKS